MNNFSFSLEQLGNLFPYYLRIDADEVILSFGNGIAQTCGVRAGDHFRDAFRLVCDPLNADEHTGPIPVSSPFIANALANPVVYIKGKFEPISDTQTRIFIGSPCYITNIEDIQHQYRLFKDSFGGATLTDAVGVNPQYESLDNFVAYFKSKEDDPNLFLDTHAEEEYAVTLSNAQGKIVWCNNSFLKLTGYPFSEVRGKRPREVVYGKRSVFIDRNFVDEMVKTGKPFYFENIGYTKKGREFWFGVTVYPVMDGRGEIVGRVHMLKDISFEKLREIEAEENRSLLQLSLEMAEVAPWSFDVISGVVTMSAQFSRLTGLEGEAADVPADRLQDIVLLDTGERFPQNILRSVSVDHPSFSFEAKIVVHGKLLHFAGRAVCNNWSAAGEPAKIIGMFRDVTAEREASRQLERQRRFYEQILDQIPADVVVFDRDHRYLFANPTAIRDQAVRKWLIGKNDFEYCAYRNKDVTLAEQRRQVFNEALALGRQLEWEEKMVSSSGETEHYLRRMSPVFNDDQELELVIGYGVNISERKRIEEQIRRNELQYRSIFDYSLALICTHDLNGIVLDVNNAAMNTLGYSRQQLVGAPLSAIIPKDKRKDFNDLYLNEVKEKGKAEGIMLATNSEGKKVYLLYQNFLVTNENNEPYVIGFSQDITPRIEAERALKKSEEKYRNIIAYMNLGLIELDTEGRVIYANNSFCEMSGYEAPEINGVRAAELFAKDEGFDGIESVLQFGETRQSNVQEIKVKNRRGDVRWWLTSGAPSHEERGIAIGSIVIFLDITANKTLELELRQAKADAELSASAKETFLANISHEIRTPLNAILGIGQLLAKTEVDSQQSFYVKTIQNAAKNLFVIINDLLDFSKMEAGMLNLEHIGFKMTDVINNAILIVKYKCEEKGLQITYVPQPNLAPVLIGDPYRINQILLNFLTNAVKFTDQGGITVACRVLEDEPGFQKLQLVVADTGIGMSEEYLANVFEKFSQEDKSITRKYGGTGLGMSISKQLIERMGGTISIFSKKNEGTTISFTLTLKKGTPADIDADEQEADEAPTLTGRKILLAEDYEINRLLINKILTHYGADVVEAENGEEALLKFGEGSFDVVLMDVQMPVKDGIETTRELRKVNSTIPIIAITANAFKSEEERCLNAGMNDYISKPFTEEKLVNIVVRWLSNGNRQTASVLP
jgi:PAS domain S-box-containing protein